MSNPAQYAAHLRKLIDGFVEGMVSANRARLAEVMTETCIYHDHLYGDFNGLDHIVSGLASMIAEHGSTPIWAFDDLISDGITGYATYVSSMTSSVTGQRLIFEGMARFRLKEGRIADYYEMFDNGYVLAQVVADDTHLAKTLRKRVKAMLASYEGTQHVP
jgi:hypothetical protein